MKTKPKILLSLCLLGLLVISVGCAGMEADSDATEKNIPGQTEESK